MRFKRCMFLTLMLFLTIFSISFVCASENLTYDQSAGELSSLSDSNPTDASNLNVDFIDESNDDSLDETSENESDDCLVYNENQLLRSSNDVEILSDKKALKLRAGNTLDILGASIDEPVLGQNQYLDYTQEATARRVMQAIVDCSNSGGGTVYLYGRTYSGTATLTAGQDGNPNILNIHNVKVVGGSPDDPNQVAIFDPGNIESTVLAFHGSQATAPDGHSGYTSSSGVNLEDVVFENLTCRARLFSFCSGSLTNVVFNNLESYEHLFFLYGCYVDSKPITLTNCNFTNCHQTYLGDNNINDGCGQLGAIFGGKLVGCNFINTSSANHGGAFCLSDEYENGPQHVASTLTDCNFINVTSRWFAVYIHGNYTDDSAHGGSTYIKDPQVLDNCKFINCKSTAEYGGALGISHNNVIIKNSEFINNTGGEGAAIMVGGIEYGHDAFWGKNTEGNNMTIENCKFINNVARTQGQNPTYVPNLTKTIYPTGNAGAVYVYGNDTKIYNTLFENNTASNDGAAIYIHGWGTIIENTTLSGNTAVNGTIYIEGSITEIVNSTFVNNTAANGAGAYVEGENTHIHISKFYNNTAANGACAYVKGDNTKFLDSELYYNKAVYDDYAAFGTTGNGAGFYVIGNNAEFSNIISLNNTADFGGGSAYVDGNNTLFENGVFSYNTAPFGGAIYIEGSYSNFFNNNITNNSAEYNNIIQWLTAGGAIFIDGDHSNFTSNNISNNYAEDDGGALFVDGSNTYFDDIIADNNNAQNGGFAQLQGATDLKVKNSIFTNNHAIGDIGRTRGCGGAFHISSSENADIQGNFYNNTAINGSAIYVEHSSLRIHDSEFFENQALTWHLAIKPENLTNFKEIDDVIITITHIGGDNIANAIHDYNRSSDIFVNNITYPFYHNGNITNKTTLPIDTRPVYSYLESENGTKIYEDEKENNQVIYYTIRNRLTNTIVDEGEIRTDIDGTILVNLTGKLAVGFYEVNGTYLETPYYTKAINITALFGMEGLNLTINKTVDKPRVYVNDEVVFTINVTNNGPFNATHVNVTDMVPNQFKVTGYNDTEYKNKTGLLVIDQLNVGDSYLFTITAVALVAGNWTNVASAVCDQNDTVVRDDATVEVLPLGTVDVTKVWNDGNNALNTRPAYITVELFGDGVSVANATLNANNNWYWSFGNLPVVNGTKRIKYTISEVTVPNYIVNVTENPDGVFVIENTLVTSVNVTKVWFDGDNADNTRPAYITVVLYGDGVKVASATLNANNNWYWSFTKLPVFNGNNRIKYTISEVTVPNYVVNVTEDPAGVFVIENTLVTSVNVTKVWNDGNNALNTRPAYISVELFGDNVKVASATLNANNNWYWSFPNLKVFNGNNRIKYTISEITVPGYETVVTNSTPYNWTVTNTELVNLTVKKVWNDKKNQDGVRPINVTVKLFADLKNVGETTLNSTNNWTYTFENLHKFSDNGKLIIYTVNETEVVNYTAIITRDNNDFLINNTHVTELVNVTVKKVWVDNGNKDGVRPVYVVVHLLRNGTAIKSTVLNAANNWTDTFLNLDKYANGRLINYTVNETRFDNYTASYSNDGMGNWTVTNTHITELVNVTVKKVWVDNDNQDGVRPVSVTVLLFADDVNIRNATLSASNNWTYTFEGLDKFKNNASLIVYRVNETEVVDYTANITDDGNGNWTINNTHVTEVVNVTVKKVWTDKGNQDGVRPVSVTVLLFADDVNIRNATLSASNNWTFTFEGLDKFKNNASLIVYRVNETEVVNYTVNITGDNGSFVINNTHITELVNVTVVKVWNDGNNASGKRPANITVVLLADGKIIRNATLSNSNGWTFTFEGLDKYRNNRTLIKYSIGEINVGVPGYTTKITNSTPYNWTVNNTYVPKINKTANVTHVFYHDFVLYNITITNIGTGIYNETLTIVDSLPYGLDYIRTVNITGARVIQEAVEEGNNVTWVITDINPNTPAIIFVLVGTYDIGNLTNNVTLIGPNGFKDIVNCTIEVEPIVDLSVNKTVDFAAHYLGDVVVWTIKVSNAYNGTNATNVTLRDILPAEFSLIDYNATKGNYSEGIWHIGFMGNGTDETLVIYSRAINAVPSVTNYANVSCNETEWNYNNNKDNATTSIVLLPPPHKVVNNATPFYHDIIKYNLTVINDGNYSFTDNITVYDILPDGLEYLSTIRITGADVVVNATVNSKNNISWVIKNIKAHSTAVIEVSVKVNAVGKLINNETLVFSDGSNMTVNCTIVAQPIVDVAVNKTVDNEFHFVGDIVVWTIKVSNAYNGTNATDVVMNDLLPAEFKFINCTPSVGSYNASSGVWDIGFMGNGTEETLVIYSRAKAIGTFVNIANVTCNETDWDEDNNVDNATVTVVDLPWIEKTVNDTRPFYHENVRYNLTVVNDADYDYTQNVVVYDILPNGLEFLRTIRVIGADVVVDTTVNSKNNISWVIKNIKAHSTAIIEVLVKVNAVGNLTNDEIVVYPDGTEMIVNCTINPRPIVDVAVEKTVDKELHFIGDIVVWTIKVSNAYNGTNATDVAMGDILPAEFEFINSTASIGGYSDATGVWDIGFMGNGTEETLVIYSRAKAVGTFVNIAKVTCNETDWNEDNNVDNATVTVLKNPDIGKTVNNTKPYHFEYVEYYLTITNTEVIDYTNNLVVIDSLPDGLVYEKTLKIEGATLVNSVVDGQIIKWTIKNIKAKSSAVITVKVLANATGNLTNNGTLVPAYGNNVTVNCTITPIPLADLEVIKLSDNSKPNTNTYYKGDTVTWTIIVINNGPDDAINAVATDFLPSGLIYVSDDSQGAFDHNTGIWRIGNLSSGDSVTLNIITNISVTNAKIKNNVDVTSETYDPNETNNHDDNTITVEPEADLGIIKLVSQVTSRYNDIVTWTLIVVNNGPDTAVGAVVTDKLPSGVVYVSDDSHGAYNHKTGVWKLGNLAKGQFKVLNIKTKVRVTNKTITNFASVTSKTYDPDTTNNKCNNSTTVGPVADLMLIKNVDKDTAKVGDKVKFTIVVKNLGPDTAVNTRAYDLLPKGLKLISYKVSEGTYNPVTGIWEIGDLECGETVEMTIIAEALVAGKIVNEAYVESDTYDNDTSNNYDNATVTVESKPPTIFQLYPTGNPVVMMLLALFAIVVVNIRKRS